MIKPVLKWVVAVALGVAIGSLGLIYFTFGWDGVVVLFAVLMGAKVG